MYIFNKLSKKAFTLTELIVVVAIIWVLMLWMTVYIWWSDERSKIIEANWCAWALGWKINNFVYYALTSKNINSTSPDYYYIQLSWLINSSTSNNCTWAKNPCTKLIFSYSTWNSSIKPYETHTVKDDCRQNQVNLWFYRSWDAVRDIKYIRMNKWFSPTSIAETKVFFLQSSNDVNKLLNWNIIILLCSDKSCSWWKEIGMWKVDARSQTIHYKKCKFYKTDDPQLCETREN